MRPKKELSIPLVLPLLLFFAGCGGAISVFTAPQTDTYTVAYSANGATGGSVPVDSNKYLSGATVTVLGNTGNLTETGYSFAGWNTATNGSGITYTPGSTFTMGSANVTLYAQWTALPTYTVTYSANGATGGSVPVDSNKYLSGATVTVLGNTGNLTDTGYSFAGWNTAANGSGTAYAAGATFAIGSANVTLYAQWTALSTYTVSYSANGAMGGSAPVDSNKYQSGAPVTVLGNTGNLTDTGYFFAGWNTAANGSGTAYAPGATLTMGSANVTLYAQWTTATQYGVNYSANGATSGSAPVDSNQYAAGATVTVLGNTGSMAESGPTFAGWNTVANGSGAGYAPRATFTMSNASITLFAQWANGGQFTVSYSGNGNTGGSVPDDLNKYAPGSLVTVLGNTGNLVRTGYTLTGWNTMANGAGASYAPGSTFTTAALSLTLYAQWAPTGPTYNVSYNGNGNTSGFGHSDPNQYQPGDAVTVYGNLGYFFRPGYVFDGWNTAPDGSGTTYAIGATFTMGSANVTLYAQWGAANWPPVSIWGGAREVITLLADGTVWTWGLNSGGELGNGNTNNESVPGQVLGPGGSGTLNNIVAVMGGELHNTSLRSDGTVWVWGSDLEDQLDAGGTGIYTSPIRIAGLSSVVMLGSRGYHSVAVESDGTVWDWGSDLDDALGNGLSIPQPTYTTPFEVQGVSNPIMVTAGYMFSLALLQDHTLVAWGNNKEGEMGNGTSGGYQTSPERVPGINNVVWVSAGWSHVVAIRSDGTVWTWGTNSWGGAFDCEDTSDNNNLGVFCGYGKLGDGTINDHYTPEQVPGLSGAVMALAGDSYTAVLLRDGSVWTFGSNGAGQLGVPNINQSLVPVQVQGLCHANYIMARDFHSQAVCSDGSVWSWGSGTSGELGNGAFNNSAVPIKVSIY